MKNGKQLAEKFFDDENRTIDPLEFYLIFCDSECYKENWKEYAEELREVGYEIESRFKLECLKMIRKYYESFYEWNISDKVYSRGHQ